MMRVVVRNPFRPSCDVNSQGRGMMLRQQQSSVSYQLHLTIIREDPGSRNHHVSLEAQNRLEDTVPRIE